jgi:hypothetical protein
VRRELLVLLALAASTGCTPTSDEDEDYYDGPCNTYGEIPFAPGQTVRGHDPQALLQPFFGTWSGPFEWRSDGARTELTLDVPRDPDEPLYGHDRHAHDPRRRAAGCSEPGCHRHRTGHRHA